MNKFEKLYKEFRRITDRKGEARAKDDLDALITTVMAEGPTFSEMWDCYRWARYDGNKLMIIADDDVRDAGEVVKCLKAAGVREFYTTVTPEVGWELQEAGCKALGFARALSKWAPDETVAVMRWRV